MVPLTPCLLVPLSPCKRLGLLQRLHGAVRSHQNVCRRLHLPQDQRRCSYVRRFDFAGSWSERTRWAGRPMKDYRTGQKDLTELIHHPAERRMLPVLAAIRPVAAIGALAALQNQMAQNGVMRAPDPAPRSCMTGDRVPTRQADAAVTPPACGDGRCSLLHWHRRQQRYITRERFLRASASRIAFDVVILAAQIWTPI